VQRIGRNILIQRHVPSLSTSNDHLTYDTDFHGHDNLFFHRQITPIDPCWASLSLIDIDDFKKW